MRNDGGSVARRRVALGLAAALLAWVVSARAAPQAVETQFDLAYGPLPAERGDFYRPTAVTGRIPVVVIIHGGGWVGGDRGPAGFFGKVLALRGIAAFNIDYRLADAAKPDTRWPAQIVDAQLAVRWLRAHAEALGIDPAHVGAVGDSAGAQLAVLLGVLPQSIGGDEAGLWADQSPTVEVVVDQFAPVDLPSLPSWIGGVYPALFGTSAPTPGSVAAMSPLQSITPHSAPVLIVQGESDPIVPMSQSVRLRDALAASGVPVELLRFPGGHAYDGLKPEAILTLQQRMADWLAAGLAK